ncbi:DUF3224 domain-containing protein [Actinopolymorpha singaporensis]|uniref:Allene oxide cyclase barrel-like domain-containing protein n=1 Tax=Actinopolymorpha singaporensis TaxID=117157 RepID=A0A1H1RP02_9ACTN|nr:DUF3224 domain-containing protein [Actinopolymorpha singaporensis]SDS36709.1 Protein of unknown function [Actinopolymorpha singaporensis]
MPSAVENPERQRSGQSTVVVVDYDRRVVSPADDSGISLVSTVLTEEFTGSLAGNGVADHVRVVRRDGTDTFTGIERFDGALDGRPGSFVLTAQGYTTARGVVHGRWEVVPGSATGELVGLRGHGVFTFIPECEDAGNAAANDVAERGAAADTLTYWYEAVD